MKDKKIKSTIWVGLEAYNYLRRISRSERGCKPLSKECEERSFQRAVRSGGHDPEHEGMRQLADGDMGGGDGTYYGRWTSWSVETMKSMLDDAGLPWEDGKPREVIDVYL